MSPTTDSWTISGAGPVHRFSREVGCCDWTIRILTSIHCWEVWVHSTGRNVWTDEWRTMLFPLSWELYIWSQVILDMFLKGARTCPTYCISLSMSFFVETSSRVWASGKAWSTEFTIQRWKVMEWSGDWAVTEQYEMTILDSWYGEKCRGHSGVVHSLCVMHDSWSVKSWFIIPDFPVKLTSVNKTEHAVDGKNICPLIEHGNKRVSWEAPVSLINHFFEVYVLCSCRRANFKTIIGGHSFQRRWALSVCHRRMFDDYRRPRDSNPRPRG